jgi:membrane protein DedA with SNARE-associated domain
MFLLAPPDLVQLLHAYGYAALGIVVALESIGIPLPGESLLIAAAVVAGTTLELNIVLVVIAAMLGAVAGQTVGYWIGRLVGPRLLRRYGHYIGLTPRRLVYSRALFRRHGVKVIFVSRFVVLLRTIAALLAGANRMPWLPFMAANAGGSAAWAALYGFAAYALGHEAKAASGPAAIVIGVIGVAALAAGAFYIRRYERRLKQSVG